MRAALILTFPVAGLALVNAAFGQALDRGTSDALRVTMSLNEDGSRTVYETDGPNRKATATTTSAGGKVQAKIRYTLDEAGRYETGEIYGPDDKLRFKTLYKYDASGRLTEETQLTKEDAVRHKIVYAFDAAGKPAGYSVLDPSGKLLGQTRSKAGAPTQRPTGKAR